MAGSAVTSSSRSCTTRMVESETSLVTVSNAGGGGSMPVFDFGDADWATLVFLESGSHIVPLYLSSGSSDGTADRCGFHRPELRLRVRGGRANAEGDDSAHDPDADGDRMAGYCILIPSWLLGCRREVWDVEGVRRVPGDENDDRMGEMGDTGEPGKRSSSELFEAGLAEAETELLDLDEPGRG